MTLNLERRIRYVQDNPKRPGSRSHSIYGIYQVGMSGDDFVSAVIAVGQPRRVALDNLRWDLDHGYVRLAAVPRRRAPRSGALRREQRRRTS